MSKRNLIIISGLLAAAVFFLYGVDKFGAFDYDEAIYCETIREMIETNDYIVPRFNYKKFYEKPVMLYWLTAGVHKIFGLKEVAMSGRIISSLASAGTAFLIFYFTAFFAGKRAGVISAVVFASSLGGIIAAKSIITDGVFVFFLTLSIFSAAKSFLSENKKIILLAYVSAAMAVLSKGPVGAAIPFLVCGIFAITERRRLKLVDIRPFTGILLFLLVALPWFVVVTVKTGGEFYKDFFLVHNLQRFGGKSFEGHTGGLLYYIPVLFFGLFPWSGFLPCVFAKPATEFVSKNKAAINKFLIIWLATPLILFSIAKTKLPNYILPVFPPMAVLIGAYLDGIIRKNAWNFMSKIAFAIVLIISLSLIVLFGAFDIIANILRPGFIQTQPFLHATVHTGNSSKLMAMILAAIPVCFYICFSFRKIKAYIIATAAIMFFFNFALTGFFMPAIWRIVQGSIYDLSEKAKKISDKKTEIVVYDMPMNPSVVLHIKRKVIFMGRSEASELFKMREANKNLMVITKTKVFREDLAKKFEIISNEGGYVLVK